MKLPDKVYTVLKWVTIVLLPALASLYLGLAGELDMPYGEIVSHGTNYVCAFLGAILGISTAEYNKDKTE